MDFAKTEGFENPVVERIAVTILVRTKGVGYTFETVDNGTSKVICGVYLPFVAAMNVLKGFRIFSSSK